MSDAITVRNPEDISVANHMLSEDFQVPSRAWEVIIDTYNSNSKRKFPFTALQCKAIVEWTKVGIYPKSIFKALGRESMFSRMKTAALDMEERLETLNTKEALAKDEYDELQNLRRNPIRILMSDIVRAEGLVELNDWVDFTFWSQKQPEIMMAKMKAKYKDLFSEKANEQTNLNVQINVGGDWADEL